MKKVIDVFALMAVIAFAAFTSGCGGGGGDDDDDIIGAGGNGVVAPASIRGQEVVLTETGGAPRRFTFATDGSSFTAFEGDTATVVRTGTFEYSAANNTAILTTRDPDGANQVVYNLNFTSADAGTFTYVTPAGQMVSGTFSNLRAIPGGDQGGGVGGGDQGGGAGGGGGGGDQGGGAGGGGGGDQGGGAGGGGGGGGDQGGGAGGGNQGGGNQGGGDTGTPPATVENRTIVFNTSSGPLIGATSVTFGPGGTFTSSNTGSGNYTYTLSGTSASLVLDYTAPSDFAGDRDTFVMTFNPGSGSTGTFTGTVRIDDSESAHSGTFQFQ